MIRFTFILSAMFLALNVSHAQSPFDLKGPAAKNYKPWIGQARAGVVLMKVAEPAKKGPAFKNRKPGKQDQPRVEVRTNLPVRERVTGPKAKNKKPWRRD